jgi:hypothetical protein
MDGGSIAAGPDGRVETVWMRAGKMYAARPGERERDLGRGLQGWNAAGPGGTYSVWLESRPGRLLTLAPKGRAPISLAELANDPVIASAAGDHGLVVAVWEAKTEGGGILAQVLTRSE